MRERRVGVLGTLVWDRIWPAGAPADGPPAVEQWGGATYALAAWAAARPDGWQVVPILRIGRDMLDAGHELVRRLLPDAPLDAVVADPGLNNRVDLHYHADGRRDEVLRGGVAPWPIDEIVPALDGLDALYVNFLSGYELRLDTLEEVRSRFSGPIYADLHSLFLGPPRDGARQPVRLESPLRWLAAVDVAQVNEHERALLCEGRPADWLADAVSRRRPLAVMETLAARGARILHAADAPADPDAWAAVRAGQEAGVVTTTVELTAPATSGDSTGCGDVWGSVMFASLLAGEGWRSAAERANRLASARLGCPAVEALPRALRAAFR